MSRIRLRNRVAWLFAAFAVALLAITFGLSWHAQRSQQRWTRLIDIELQAVASLEELIREQNGFMTQIALRDARAADRYRTVEQLLEDPSLRDIDVSALRTRVAEYRRRLEANPVNARALGTAGRAVVLEAQIIMNSRKGEIARQIPRLQRDTQSMANIGVGVAWIVLVLSLCVTMLTVQNVVVPVERLAKAAKAIGRGDADARAPIAGDHELIELGKALNEMADELKKRARTDDLTALPNFRAFRERIEAEIERGSRYRMQFGVLVLDLDRFKQYNDTYGHLAGNEALRRVAMVIKEAVRVVDFPARYGGEEFAVVLPQTDLMSLARVAERIRSSVEALPAPLGGAAVTVSIGGAIFPVDGVMAEELFQVADERLYAAKRLGRNRAIVTTPAQAVQSAG